MYVLLTLEGLLHDFTSLVGWGNRLPILYRNQLVESIGNQPVKDAS